MSEVAFVRLVGGTLDQQYRLVDLPEDGWPMPQRAWFVRTRTGVMVVAAEPDGSRPSSLNGLRLDRYRLTSTSGVREPAAGGNLVHGAVYTYDPEPTD